MRSFLTLLVLLALGFTTWNANAGPKTAGFGGGSNYSLPAATTAALGGVIVGSGLAITSTGVLSATGTGGGSSVAISDTASNVTYYSLFATNTSAAAATVYVDKTSPFSYNASTGLVSMLGITTTSLTDSGNAALNGTTTILTSRITGGTINNTTIGATTSSTALFTTVTATTAVATNALLTTATATTLVDASLTSTTTTILSSLTTGWLSVNGAGLVASGLGSAYIQPSSLYTTTTDGTLYPNVYTGTGGNASASEAGWAIANTITASAADQAIQVRFPMPAAIPPGTFNLCSKCLAATATGILKYTVSDANVADGSSPSAATLTAETQSSLSFTTTDGYLNTCTVLTSTPTVNSTSAVAVTFNRTNTTVGVPVTCRWQEVWK